MTGRTRTSSRAPLVEIRVLLPAEAHQDITAMARTTGLATSQFIRTLVMTYVAKTYAQREGDR